MNVAYPWTKTALAFGFLGAVLYGCTGTPAMAVSASELPEVAMEEAARDMVLGFRGGGVIGEVPADGKLVCRRAETFAGETVTCSVQPANNECRAQEVRVCVRRYGIRACGCYPE